MEEELRALLLADVDVAALVGNRVDFGGSPEGTRDPRIVGWTIDDAEGHSTSGPDGLSQGRVQLDCYGETYKSAKLLSRAVRRALDGYSGGGFQGIFLDGVRDTREGGSNEAYRPMRVSLDFLTKYNFT